MVLRMCWQWSGGRNKTSRTSSAWCTCLSWIDNGCSSCENQRHRHYRSVIPAESTYHLRSSAWVSFDALTLHSVCYYQPQTSLVVHCDASRDLCCAAPACRRKVDAAAAAAAAAINWSERRYCWSLKCGAQLRTKVARSGSLDTTQAGWY